MKYFPLLILLFFVSCNKKSSPSISSEELLTALNGHCYRIRMPDDLQKSDYVGIALRYSDGGIQKKSGDGFLKPGEIVTFILLNPPGSEASYTLISDLGSTHSRFKETSETMSFADPDVIHEVGDPLIWFWRDSKARHENKLEDGDFELFIMVSPSNAPP